MQDGELVDVLNKNGEIQTRQNNTAPASIKRPQCSEIHLAVGWALLTGAMSVSVLPDDFAVVLFVLVFAEISSALLVMDLISMPSTKPSSRLWEDTLGHIMVRWVMFVFSALALNQTLVIPVFEHHDYAMVCLLGLCLILALLKLVFRCQINKLGLGSLLVSSRYILLSAGVLAVAKIASLNADVILSLAMALLLSLLVLTSFRAKFCYGVRGEVKPTSNQSKKAVSLILVFLFRYIDVFLIAFVLPIPHLLIYLVARGVAGIVPLALDHLESRIFSALETAHLNGGKQKFASLAARTNLGFLLIGGSATLISLTAGRHAPTFLSIDSVIFRDVFFWLLIAEVAPVIFGATGIILRVSENTREVIALSLLGVLAALATTLMLDFTEAQQLAKSFACIQMSVAAISAALIGVRSGIWPGVTAILFRKIRLF